MTRSRSIKLKNEKLEALREAEVIAADPEEKFGLRKKIEALEAEIANSLEIEDDKAFDILSLQSIRSRDREQYERKGSRMIFEEMRRSLLHLGLLFHLDGWPSEREAPNLTRLCDSLAIPSRKSAYQALVFLESQGLVEKVKISKSALWRISDDGKRLLERLAGVSRIRIETAGS